MEEGGMCDSMCDCDHCMRHYGEDVMPRWVTIEDGGIVVMPDRSQGHDYNPDCDCTHCNAAIEGLR